MALVTANISIASVSIYFNGYDYVILILSQSDIDQFPAGVVAGTDNIICAIDTGVGDFVVIDIMGLMYDGGESPPETESWITQFTIVSGDLSESGNFPLTSVASESNAIHFDFDLIINLAQNTAFNFELLVELSHYSMATLNADFILRFADDYQSVVVDIHTPETPIDGAYA